jgi:uncharacterized protein YaaR (DUF327 family)
MFFKKYTPIELVEAKIKASRKRIEHFEKKIQHEKSPKNIAQYKGIIAGYERDIEGSSLELELLNEKA